MVREEEIGEGIGNEAENWAEETRWERNLTVKIGGTEGDEATNMEAELGMDVEVGE